MRYGNFMFMRYGDFSWLFIILFIGVMFFMRGCGWGGGCGVPRISRRKNHNHDNNESEALQILNKRYANGEIDSDKYNQMKEEILRR